MTPLHLDGSCMYTILKDIRKKARESKHPVLVAVTGISGSGKSVLCSILQQQLRHCAILELDGYNFGKEARNKNGITGAHPDAFDKEKAGKDLLMVKAGRCIRLPIEPAEQCITVSFQPEKIVLVDGQTALFVPEWKRMYDYVIFVECKKEVLWKRKQAENDAEHIFKLRLQQYQQYIEPQKGQADMVIISQPATPS
ncbi:AAA family ATPase [Candidatus Woesearchaeota archaeon]|nr:AAA family ATPase [Candidatus Woesearchaeota archaeon]